MGNEFDKELVRVADEAHAESPEIKAQGADRLVRLKTEIESSSKAREGVVDVIPEEEGLLIAVRGQAIGEWRNEGSNLALFRAGSPDPECHATSVAEAVKLTARLVAAVAQA